MMESVDVKLNFKRSRDKGKVSYKCYIGVGDAKTLKMVSDGRSYGPDYGKGW